MKMAVIFVVGVLELLVFQAGASLMCHRCQYVTSSNSLAEGLLSKELAAQDITSDPKCQNAQSLTAESCSVSSVFCGKAQVSLEVDVYVEEFDTTLSVPIDTFFRGCFPDDDFFATLDADTLESGCHPIQNYTSVLQIILTLAADYNPEIQQMNGTICFCNEDSCNNCTGDIDIGDCAADSSESSDPCESEPCDPNATCEPTATGYTCTCNDGYQETGDTCTAIPSATSCYSCQYVTTDDDFYTNFVVTQMEAGGLTNEPSCKSNPSDEFVRVCPTEGASCGTTQATLDVVAEYQGNPTRFNMEVFSRGCFPDPDSPNIEADEVTDGCHDAKNYEDFFTELFVEGATGIKDAKAQLDGISGGMCFCDDKDKCNDCKSVTKDECVTDGAGSLVMSLPLVLIGVLLTRFYH